MAHYAEIADALAGREYMPPAYKARSFKNRHGKTVVRMEFESPADLELFFTEELIGSGMMEGSASKAIGSVLLIWDK